MTSGEGATSWVLALINLSKAWLPASASSSGSPRWAACCSGCCVCRAWGTGAPCPGCGAEGSPVGPQIRSLQVEMPTPRSCSGFICLAAGSKNLKARQAAGKAAQMHRRYNAPQAPGRIGGRPGSAEQQLAVACSKDTLSSYQGSACTKKLWGASRRTVQLPMHCKHHTVQPPRDCMHCKAVGTPPPHLQDVAGAPLQVRHRTRRQHHDGADSRRRARQEVDEAQLACYLQVG